MPRRDPHARVGHLENGIAVAPGDGEVDPSRRPRVPDSVVEQVPDQQRQARRRAEDGDRRVSRDLELEVVGLGRKHEALGFLGRHEIETHPVPRGPLRLESGEVEEIAHDPAEPRRIPEQAVGKAPGPVRVVVHRLADRLRGCPDRCDGRLQLV